MRILYGYSNCTDETFNTILSENNPAQMLPDQKYHGLMIKGLSKNGAQLLCLSGLPINRAVTKRLLIRYKDEQEDNARFHYITTLNIPIIRQLMIFCGTFFGVLKEKKTADTFAVCDCLNLANAYGMTLAARLKKIPVISIVTDLPDAQRSSGLLRKINNSLFNMTDAFILLTEQLSRRINKNNKPYIVLEGHVDSEAPLPDEQTPYELTEGKKIILYAGKLRRIYGIHILVSGFLEADIPDSELRIYGDGEVRRELEERCKEHPNVRYMGVKNNREIVTEEQKAALLVNPRPVAPDYTDYCFPSKNMEYMVSGTPLLTTKLPGIVPEYEPYVYLIEEDTPQGIAESFTYVFSKSFEERRQLAQKAREFVLREKTNVVQAKKIIDFLETLK